MGMFDTLYFPCPHCGELTGEQSKAGGCMLDSYNLGDCPPAILCDIVEDQEYRTIYCEHCNKPIRLELIVKPAVMVTKG